VGPRPLGPPMCRIGSRTWCSTDWYSTCPGRSACSWQSTDCRRTPATQVQQLKHDIILGNVLVHISNVILTLYRYICISIGIGVRIASSAGILARILGGHITQYQTMWLGCKIIEDFILLQRNTPWNNGNGKKPRSHFPNLRICLLAYLRSLILQMKVVRFSW